MRQHNKLRQVKGAQSHKKQHKHATQQINRLIRQVTENLTEHVPRPNKAKCQHSSSLIACNTCALACARVTADVNRLPVTS